MAKKRSDSTESKDVQALEKLTPESASSPLEERLFARIRMISVAGDEWRKCIPKNAEQSLHQFREECMSRKMCGCRLIVTEVQPGAEFPSRSTRDNATAHLNGANRYFACIQADAGAGYRRLLFEVATENEFDTDRAILQRDRLAFLFTCAANIACSSGLEMPTPTVGLDMIGYWAATVYSELRNTKWFVATNEQAIFVVDPLLASVETWRRINTTNPKRINDSRRGRQSMHERNDSWLREWREKGEPSITSFAESKGVERSTASKAIKDAIAREKTPPA